MVTTHRLLWIDAGAAPSAGASCSLPLAAVQHAQLRGRMLGRMPLGTPKVHVTVRVTGAEQRVQAGPPPAALLVCRAHTEAPAKKDWPPDCLVRKLATALREHSLTRVTRVTSTAEPPQQARVPSAFVTGCTSCMQGLVL